LDGKSTREKHSKCSSSGAEGDGKKPSERTATGYRNGWTRRWLRLDGTVAGSAKPAQNSETQNPVNQKLRNGLLASEEHRLLVKVTTLQGNAGSIYELPEAVVDRGFFCYQAKDGSQRGCVASAAMKWPNSRFSMGC
jgi:hypothetical protein